MACNHQVGVQFPGDPPSFGGLAQTVEHWSEKPAARLRVPHPPPDVAVAEWLRREAVNLSMRVRFSPATPISGVRLMAGPLALNQDAEVRFFHSRPLAAGAIGSALRSERRGSRFETWAASQSLCPRSQIGLAQRYERCLMQVRVLSRVPFRPVVQTDRAMLSEGINHGSTPCRPTRFTRRWPIGKALDCRSRPSGIVTRPPRQSFMSLSSKSGLRM